jgi:hypothetical protein
MAFLFWAQYVAAFVSSGCKKGLKLASYNMILELIQFFSKIHLQLSLYTCLMCRLVISKGLHFANQLFIFKERTNDTQTDYVVDIAEFSAIEELCVSFVEEEGRKINIKVVRSCFR